MYPTNQIQLLRHIYGPNVEERRDGQNLYLFIPGLTMPQNCTPNKTDALFCTQSFAPTTGGYTSRLFLKDNVESPHKPNNYQSYLIAGETWYAFSHNNVVAGPFPEMILNHLRGFLIPC
ncbi:hypothetical protein ABES03_10255 [Neobacillus rhizosphaerae]|uniref:hypothetical protein n=1 Tax=Neobacillus rhizosphaerae TaxID=2880965 RepID=UPI003D2B7389